MATDTRIVQVDPNFPLPDELQFAVYAEDTPVILVGDDAEGEDNDDAFSDVTVVVESDDNSEILEDESSDELDTPTNIAILSQTVRTGTDGRSVVDVVIQVDEVFGAVKYEVRVTKT